MLTNSEIKRIRALREKKFREEYGMFVVEGEKLVSEALNSTFEVLKVYRKEEIGVAAMERISLCASASPVLALVALPKEEDESFELPSGLALALDSIQDPGNLGTILRIADWFGIKKVYSTPESVETFNPKTVQASMGSVFRVKLSRVSLVSLCNAYKAAGRAVCGTMMKGENIYNTELPQDGLVIMGNESFGIAKEIESLLDKKLSIPSFGGGAESLNVAAATAITLSEFRRRC